MIHQEINHDLSLDFVRNYPDQAASILEGLAFKETLSFVQMGPSEIISKLLSHLNLSLVSQLLSQLDGARIKPLLHSMSSYSLLRFLSHVEDAKKNEYISMLQPSLKSEIMDLMDYPEDCAGHLMDFNVCSFLPHITVAEALKKIRHLNRKVIEVYLVDSEGHYLATISLTELALANSNERLDALPKSQSFSVNDVSFRDEVVELLEKKRLFQIPVLDFEQRLKGVIRQEALVNALQNEASTDLQAMVGVSRDERAMSQPYFSFRKRHPWLQINLVTAFIAAAVVGIFENTIAQFTVLAILLPVVAGQSGNTGSQAMAVVMRGLSLREILPKHWIQMVFKESRVGLMNGLGVATTTCLGVYIWSGSHGLAAIIFISMITSMVIASISGASVPIILMKLGQDPATSASIILTTVTDVFGFLSFLGIATLLSSWL
jgi:magnesium transporter